MRYVAFAVLASLMLVVFAACGAQPAPADTSAPASTTEAMEDTTASSDTIKVGILHSLSGTMAISEKASTTRNCWPYQKSTPPAVFWASNWKS